MSILWRFIRFMDTFKDTMTLSGLDLQGAWRGLMAFANKAAGVRKAFSLLASLPAQLGRDSHAKLALT